jgi:signal transduction histidine kinase
VPAFLFSFEPEVVEEAWRSLQARIVLTNPDPLVKLEALVEQYYPVIPDYRTVTQFSRLLLKRLSKVQDAVSEVTPVSHTSRREARSEVSKQEDSLLLAGVSSLSYSDEVIVPPAFSSQDDNSSPRPDVELLKAFAHEVRTPLTTIRTLTRLLLKRCDLAIDVIKRLKIIDHECTEQIDRMELLFRAAELETSTVKPSSAHLTAMSLDQVLQQSIPRWQQSANRRNLTLDVVLPQQLPMVVSDPIMLDQVLTGLIENFTRSLAAGSHIQVQVIPAGDQLKLQLLTQAQPGESGMVEFPTSTNSEVSWATTDFPPETGNISLNFAATKHLFQAIGGKLIVRQRPHQGEVVTIFLPMDVSRTDFCHQGKGFIHQSVN